MDFVYKCFNDDVMHVVLYNNQVWVRDITKLNDKEKEKFISPLAKVKNGLNMSGLKKLNSKALSAIDIFALFRMKSLTLK